MGRGRFGWGLSVADEKGVGRAFTADGCVRFVTRVDRHVVFEGEEYLSYGCHESVVIAVGKVGSTDRAGKQAVTRKNDLMLF